MTLVTPPGAFGVVFGFVSAGFNVAGMIAPLLHGWLMDQGEPRIIFICAAAFTALALMANTARAKARRWRARLNRAAATA